MRTTFKVGDWHVDPDGGRLTQGDSVVKLEPKVMDLLLFMAEHPARVVSREQIESAVWSNMLVGYDTVTGAIQKLRRALGDSPRKARFIETVPKRGYRLIATVSGPGVDLQSDAGFAVPDRRRSKRVPALLFLALSVLVGIAVAIWQSSLEPAHAPAAETPPKTIAVLPFDNLSPDQGQSYFADGVTDDLITSLARNGKLLVISRESTFHYQNESMEPGEIARRLHAEYLLLGSVRRVADRVLINVQLVDAPSGTHLWAEHYETPLDALFQVQDKITSHIASTLLLKVNGGEQQDFGPPRTRVPDAYDAFLQGRQLFYRYASRQENQAARRLFERAIDLDPAFAQAYAMSAWTHAFDAMNGWTEDRNASLQRAAELASEALDLNPALPIGYFVRGLAYREQGEYVKALVEAQQATEYDPNYANAQVLQATLLYYAGRPEEGLERLKQAIAINPHHPYNYMFHLGQAYFVLHRYDEAIAAFRDGLESNPGSERLHLWLAAALGQKGQLDDASWEAESVLAMNPDFSIERIEGAFPFSDQQDRQHFVEGLTKAGLNR